MININRIKIIVRTAEETFGLDETFEKKINFVASNDNTYGKSSCLEAIYYCLGMEELIGGRDERALKPVFRSKLEFNKKEYIVLESEFFLQISNAQGKIVTINRAGKKENLGSNLMRIYHSKIDDIYNSETVVEDMYVHLSGGATNEKGFHRFLETFLGFELPTVPCFDEAERKLYLQIIFSAFFIEQKRGWGDLFATLPTYLKVKEAKKRIVEFILGLESLKNEKLKQQYKENARRIKRDWGSLYRDIERLLKKIGYRLEGIDRAPYIIDENNFKQIKLMKILEDGRLVELQEEISSKYDELEKIKEAPLSLVRDVGELQQQLNEVKEKIMIIEKTINEKIHEKLIEEANILSLEKNIDVLQKDIINNKDAQKLKTLGSNLNIDFSTDICPVCHNKIQDSLLLSDNEVNFMTIEENIVHLKAQKNVLEIALKAQKNKVDFLTNYTKELEGKMLSYNKIARSLINDIYSSEETTSEAQIVKKIELENEIEKLIEVKNEVIELMQEFKILSEKWKQNLVDISLLPNTRYTEEDNNKILKLEEKFIENIKEFGYTSTTNFSMVKINEDKLLPTIENFDMKFDSSASDNIRAIWAYILALMETAFEMNGNHSKLLIFDEPAQHSIVARDMKKFFDKLIGLSFECQVIVGITLKDTDILNVIDKLDKKEYKIILFEQKALSPYKVNQ
ncbi:MAG: hypothetical protein ACLSH8_04030 [Zhenhengia sp.]|uniref:hypothetical protein n=1 Tax=Zhenhengia sp. TaxID=2944208 RepID=UPI0039954AA3